MNNKGESTMLVLLLVLGIGQLVYNWEKTHQDRLVNDVEYFFNYINQNNNCEKTGNVEYNQCDYCRILENEMLGIEEKIDIVNLCQDCQEYLNILEAK